MRYVAYVHSISWKSYQGALFELVCHRAGWFEFICEGCDSDFQADGDAAILRERMQLFGHVRRDVDRPILRLDDDAIVGKGMAARDDAPRYLNGVAADCRSDHQAGRGVAYGAMIYSRLICRENG